ncbi:MAG: insulinase family protein, partial [Alphaproteobacteria bacterium]
MAMLSMKRASLSLVMGVLLVSGCLVLGAIKDAQAMEIKQVTSKKGINGWLIRDSMVPIFTLHFAFRGGAALD